MEILKELNKDDSLESVKNGSMIHAMNVMVSKDGSSIQNETSLETIVTLPDDVKIVGIIACAVELVIFCDNNTIYRYKENTNELIEVANSWKWYGGEVFGTYTYNVRGDLIVAISERYTTEDVPLKIINIDNADLGSDNIYTLNPDIPQATVVSYGTEKGGRMRVGTYLVFIRYEINDNEYTGWRDLGIVIYNKSTIKEEVISSITLQGYKDSTSVAAPTFYLTDQASEDLEYVPSSIKVELEIKNKTVNTFKSFQIAYVCTYKDGKEAFNLGNYQFTPTNKYTISGSRAIYEELSVEDLLISANSFNLYNVKTMCNYNNRLYVANYKEKTNDIDIEDISTDSIRVGIYTGKDHEDNYLPYDVKPTEDEAYRFYIHYVYPDGSYTDGLLIENNNLHDFEGKKLGIQITIGTYSNFYEGIYDRPIYMTCYEDTKVSEVKAAINAAKSNPKYPNYSDVTIKDKLSLITMATNAGVDYYWFNLDPRTKKSVDNKIEYCCTFINNNGDRLFRTPHRVKGNFRFENIKMYEGFVGYFISYEEIDSILIGDGIIDQHRTIALGGSSTILENGNFQSTAVDTVETQFYTEDIYVLKKSNKANVLVDLAYLSFKARDEYRNMIANPYAAHYITFDCSPLSNREYTMANLNSYEDGVTERNIAIDSELVTGSAGQYYKINFMTGGKAVTPTSIDLKNNGEMYKITTFGRLLYINQEIYIQKEGVKLIRLGPTKYVDYNGSESPIWTYGSNKLTNNLSAKTILSTVFMFDARGVRFAGDWCPRYSLDGQYVNVDNKYYTRFQEITGISTHSRDMMHVNAAKFYRQVPYHEASKTFAASVPEVYFTYNFGSKNVVKNIANKQLTADVLYGLYTIASFYSDYARPTLVAYNARAVANQIETYGNFIRRSNVIQSESTNNAWRQFPANGYKVISENKGNITNIVGIGLYFIVHCEHSMFIFNRDSTLATKDKDVQIYIPDAFDTEYQEVFTSEKGFGGLQDYNAFTCNESGYIFFDRSKRKLYRFDEKQLNDLTDGVQYLIEHILDDKTKVKLGIDKENNRLLTSFTGKVSDITLSYSFITSSWISAHSYISNNYYNTKTNLYALTANAPNLIAKIGIKGDYFLDYKEFVIPKDRNIFFSGIDDTPYSVIDVLFNLQYNTIKTLNFITYDIRKEGDINYSGDKILIFTNSCISTLKDVLAPVRNRGDVTKPYYEQGRWNFNYFRSLINDVVAEEPIDRLTGNIKIILMDENGDDLILEDARYTKHDTLIVGKYIGIRIMFLVKDAKTTISDIECYVNKYRE